MDRYVHGWIDVALYMWTTAVTPPRLRPPVFWLHVGAGVAAGLSVGGVLLGTTTPVFEASASVLVESQGPEVNMLTEAELVRSTQTATDAFARLTPDPVPGDVIAPPGDPAKVGRLAAVEPVPGTSILVITFEASSAAAAQAGATAFAEAYLAGRSDAARTAINVQIESTQGRLDEIARQVGEVDALIGALAPDAPELGSAQATRAALSDQAASLTARLNELRTTTVTAGRIVAQAPLPAAPVRPDRPRYLGLAAAAGGLAGAAMQLARARWSPRVRQAGDLRRHRGVPLLAELGPMVAPTGRESFNRLRNEVEAALRPSDHTILVTGAAPGPASLLVSANLAAAFARAGSDVVLVGASVPDLDSPPSTTGVEPANVQPITLAAVFDLADIPGLTDVLAGRTSLPSAVQRAARNPRLRVVTPGGTASAAGLLQSGGARSVLRQLANRARYVIVDAPSTASGADAQSLASAADAALLVVELGHARHAQVGDAATQLARVGTRLLGAVVVSPLSPADLPRGRDGTGSADARDLSRLTEAWIAGPIRRLERSAAPEQTAALDGPTTKLDVLNRAPLTRSPASPEAAASADPAAARRAGSPPASA